MKWVSYTRSISSRIGEENPSNTIAEQNERIAQYLKKRGCSISEKYSDRKRTAEAAEGFDRLVQDGMARKFDAVVVDSIFRCGRTLPFAIEALQRTFYPLGIQFAVAEDDFCSADKTAEEVAEYFNGKTIDKIRSEFITNRQNHFEEGTLTHRQAKYGYALSEDRRNLVLNPESAQVVKLIFQMYLEDMKIPEIARALEAQGVPSPQIQMAKKKRSRTKIKWPDSTIRLILKNPLYIGKCTLTLAKAKRELEVPAIVSETEFQKAQKKLESTRLPSRKKARKKPNLLFKKIYDKESGKGLLCRTSEDVNTTSVRTLPEDKWIIAENAHAAIVTRDEYYQAQKAIRNVTPIQYKVGDDFALKGKICCGNCNRQLRHERQYGEMVFYCGYKRSAGKFSKCYGGYYREYSVNAKVARAIKTVFYALDVVNQGMQEKQSITVRCVDIEDLEKQAEAIRVEQIKLYESYADGVLRRDVYIEKKKTLSEKLAALQDSIRTEKEEQECADELDEEIRNLTKQASQKTYIGGLTKECVDAFVSMVYLYDDQTMKVEFNCEDVIRRALEKYGT